MNNDVICALYDGAKTFNQLLGLVTNDEYELSYMIRKLLKQGKIYIRNINNENYYLLA